MSTQGLLFDVEPSRSTELTFEELMARPVTWYSGVPDTSEAFAYVVLIRSPFDPERLRRSEQRKLGRGFEAWREDLRGDPRAWAAKFVRLLRDGQSRTFNRLVLDATGRLYTADTASGKAPERGLWLAVEKGLLWWAHLDDGATWFAQRIGRSG